MAELLESTMLVCFGLSWPMNLAKNIKAKSAKTMSLQFILLIIAGYIAGISAKIYNHKFNYVLAVYLLNLDRFEQFCHGHTGITLPETLSALKFKNNRQVVCLHAVVQETIVPDFLKTGRQDVHQIAADEFNVVQCNGAFWAAGF